MSENTWRIREEDVRESVRGGSLARGLIAQKVFEDVAKTEDGNIDGMILPRPYLRSNGEMVKRFLKTDLWKSLKITYAFIANSSARIQNPVASVSSAKRMEEDAKKYMRLINDSSKARLLDLRKLNEELPIADKSGGKKGKEKVLCDWRPRRHGCGCHRVR